VFNLLHPCPRLTMPFAGSAMALPRVNASMHSHLSSAFNGAVHPHTYQRYTNVLQGIPECNAKPTLAAKQGKMGSFQASPSYSTCPASLRELCVQAGRQSGVEWPCVIVPLGHSKLYQARCSLAVFPAYLCCCQMATLYIFPFRRLSMTGDPL
jgi:hypothetical protein